MSEPLSDERLHEMRNDVDGLLAWRLQSREFGATEPGPSREAVWFANDLLDLLRDHDRLRVESERLHEESERLRADSERLRADSERLRAEYERLREQVNAAREASGQESDQESDDD
jgi:uncharacterized coiled-coil DUF342 family protein